MIASASVATIAISQDPLMERSMGQALVKSSMAKAQYISAHHATTAISVRMIVPSILPPRAERVASTSSAAMKVKKPKTLVGSVASCLTSQAYSS